MNVGELAGNRWAKSSGGKGPLLIPSYSSKGFPQVSTIFEITKAYCSRVMLISAYDLYHHAIAANAVQAADEVFIDSGGYENSKNQFFEPFGSYKPRLWNRFLHEYVLRSVRSSNQIVAITYDGKNAMKIERQIAQAQRFASRLPNFKIDFLVKPDPSTIYINPERVSKKVNDLAVFDCVGFTEKELGASLYEKCKAVIAIRSALNTINAATPIHIFGCLDQVTLLSLFLCGADVFDGLTWLKYSINEGGVFYFNSVFSRQENISRPSDDCMILMMVENLEYLRNLQKAMQNCIQSQSIDGLPIIPSMKDKIRTVLQNVGLAVK